MNEKSNRLRTIFNEVLDRENPIDRKAYLDEACKDDSILRQQVEEIISAHENASHFLKSNPQGLGWNADTQSLTAGEKPMAEGPGTVVGDYKLLQKIGEGGFGIVYMAEQREPVVRKVALKIIKLGMDTRQIVARFEAERQALALMDHPCIAKVLSAGSTESGRPYFCMELVKGLPITQYCDTNHLTTQERLELFIQVCNAVHHAHQKGIIHRDIKPSNVMVTLHDGKPVPKVIDFGIAKATQQRLTEKTIFTQYAQLIGTPAYMSPEQAEMSGLDIDTRTDIYSLGVLLYELMTGSPPFDPGELLEKGYDEMRRIVREIDPPKPSTRLSTLKNEELTAAAQRRKLQPEKLGRVIRGELDWIVMKALEKDRTRRYESSLSFAQDLRHYLSNEPVSAAAPSALYSLRKFGKRNKSALTAAIAFVLLLLTATAVSSWQAIRAMKAETLADERATSERIAKEGEQEQRKIAEEQRRKVEERELETRKLTTRLTVQQAQSALSEGKPTQALKQYANLIRLDTTNQVAVSHAMALLTRHKFILPDAIQIPLKNSPSQVAEIWQESALSPKGTLLTAIIKATAEQSERLRIWSATDGSLLLDLKATANRRFDMPFFTDDESLAAVFERDVSMDKQKVHALDLYRIQKGERLWSKKIHDNLQPTSDQNWAFASLTSPKNHLLAVYRTSDGKSMRCTALSTTDGSTVWTTTFPWQAGLLKCAAHEIGLAVGLGEELRFIDATSGEIRLLNGPTEALFSKVDAIHRIRFLPRGDAIVLDSLGPERKTKVVDVSRGSLRFEINADESVFSPDGSRIYTKSHGLIGLYDARSGKRLHFIESSRDYGLNISPDGRVILDGVTPLDAWSLYRLAEPVVSTDRPIPSYRFLNDKIQYLLSTSPEDGLRFQSYQIDPSNPMRHLPFVQQKNGMVPQAPIQAGSAMGVTSVSGLKPRQRVMTAEFSRDGSRIIAISQYAHPESEVRIFETASGELLENRRIPIPFIEPKGNRWPRLDFNSQSALSFIHGANQNDLIRVFSIDTFSDIMQLPGQSFRRRIAVSNNGATILALDNEYKFAVANLHSKEVFRIPYGEAFSLELREMKRGSVPSIFLADSGKFIAIETRASEEAKFRFDIWSVQEKRKLFSMDSDKPMIWFIPDNNHILVVNADQASIYDLPGGQPAFEPWHRDGGHPNHFWFEEGSDWIMAGELVWNYRTGEIKEVLLGKPENSGPRLFSPNWAHGPMPFPVNTPYPKLHPDKDMALIRLGGPAQLDSFTAIKRYQAPPSPAPVWFAEALEHIIAGSRTELKQLATKHGGQGYYGMWLKWQAADVKSRSVQFDAPWSRSILINRLSHENDVLHLLFAHELAPDNPVLTARLAYRLFQNRDRAYDRERISAYLNGLIEEAITMAPLNAEIQRMSSEIGYPRETGSELQE